LWTYGCLVAFLAVVAVVVRFVPAGPLAGALSWKIIVPFSAAGLLGLYLTGRARFPQMWDANVSARARFVAPSLVGAGFGLLTALHAWLRPGGDGPVTPFPVSVLVFVAGGILLETLLRLFGVTTLTAAIGVFGSRAREIGFWLAAVGASLYEPLPFLPQVVHDGQVSWSPALVALTLFAFNLTAAFFLRRAGFLAALSERWGEYLVWHVIGQGLLGLR
jgi:hypothetical protein